MKNAFLVGCPRSGTTLLQSMIASHSQIISFPETHFFSGTMPINPVLRRLKWYGKGDQKKVLAFLKSHGYNLNPFQDASNFYPYQRWCSKLGDVLDQMAEHVTVKQDSVGQVACWIEKTPRHLHFVSSIEKSAPQPKFIHILREGKDVVASLHLATKEHPDEWNGERSVKKCIQWWNRDIEKSLSYRNRPNHFFVVYRQLITEPEKVLRKVCDFLSVEYQQEMTTEFHQSATALTSPEELWKNRNTSNELKKSRKLRENFDEPTIQYITDKTVSVDLSSFYL
ncbi:MAG TPA: sulfotransferase [Balneolaceae bacterium]